MANLDIMLYGFHLIENVGDIEEGCFLQTDINEGRLHAREHPDDSAAVDVADNSQFTVALDVELGNVAALQEGNPRLMGRGVDDQFFGHGLSPSRLKV